MKFLFTEFAAAPYLGGERVFEIALPGDYSMEFQQHTWDIIFNGLTQQTGYSLSLFRGDMLVKQKKNASIRDIAIRYLTVK